MRWVLSALVWEDLGRRPAMISLTYPKEWREFANSGPEIQGHLAAFRKRWERRWGESIRGVWVREFQKRGAPHFHMYVGLPEAVTDADYGVLVSRTIRRKQREAKVGKWEARHSLGPLTGEFGVWVTSSWSAVMGSDGHHVRYGADVAPFFWGGTVAEAAAGNVNWGRVADYLWQESGKWGQKRAPEGFLSQGRAWGRWGVRERVATAEAERAAAMDLRRVLRDVQQRRWKVEGKVGRPSRGLDGLTVFDFDRAMAVRLIRWADETATFKRKGHARRSGSAGVGAST